MNNSVEMNLIVQIFEKNLDKIALIKDITDNKINWFNSVLDDMRIFGFHECRGHSIQLSKGISAAVMKKDISISNFCIVEVNRLYPRALIELYNNVKWSHAGVLKLLKYVVSGEMTQYLKEIGKPHYITDMKMFTNMVYGLLITDKSNLRIDHPFVMTDFNNACSRIMNDVVIKCGRTEDVVLLDLNTVLFCHSVDTININALTDKSIDIIGASSKCGDVRHRAFKVLNFLCRKHKVDILP